MTDGPATLEQKAPISGGTILLERERQSETLSELLERARRRSGQLAFVSGEAGAGKTALINALAASMAHARIVSGPCDGADGTVRRWQ
jgi:type II secretory pathway predicted ATPase ExeA